MLEPVFGARMREVERRREARRSRRSGGQRPGL